MPILNLQKRARELGRIRLGQKGDKGQPQKLERFRFTSNSEPLLTKVAELYGGEVRPWEDGTQTFELLSNSNRIPIMVPPQPVTQWHEAWRRSGCVHRCDGERNVLTDEMCDPEDPLHLEALGKPTTRLNVVLRDVEGIGVWRVESHGWSAATELPDVAEFLARAGGYVEGWLSLEQRSDIIEVGGKTQTVHYMVPIIEIDVTPAELLAGKGSVGTPSVEGPVPRAAIEAAPSDPNLAPYFELLEQAKTAGDVMAVFEKAKADGILGDAAGAGTDHPLYVAIGERGRALSNQDVDEEEVEGELVEDEPADTNALWMQCVAKAGELGYNLWTLEEQLAEFAGVKPNEADGFTLKAFLEDLGRRSEQVNA